MALPQLYRIGKEEDWFRLARFLYFMFEGAFQVSQHDAFEGDKDGSKVELIPLF